VAAGWSLTLADLRGLLADEALVSDFLSLWDAQLACRPDKGSSTLLIDGLTRLRSLCGKGLPKEARDYLFCAEMVMRVQYRDLKRRCWRQFLIEEGCPHDWKVVTATSTNAYLPPDVPLFGAAFICYCKEPDSAAAGQIRVAGAEQPIPFVASYMIESTIHVQRQFTAPISIEHRVEAGSDPICIADIGYCDHPGRWSVLA
jgi:hypothetical protein